MTLYEAATFGFAAGIVFACVLCIADGIAERFGRIFAKWRELRAARREVTRLNTELDRLLAQYGPAEPKGGFGKTKKFSGSMFYNPTGER